MRCSVKFWASQFKRKRAITRELKRQITREEKCYGRSLTAERIAFYFLENSHNRFLSLKTIRELSPYSGGRTITEPIFYREDA